jgi:NAD(P)-dependent dehydrogenase (short-subunit alcohol dehydrogenase family)
MVLPFIYHYATNGPPEFVRQHARPIIYATVAVAVLVLVKLFASGRSNPAERPLHGKVVILTGGTTGIGAKVADELAGRGAQLVLLTRVPPSDPFLSEYIQDLRDKHDNQLIYAEQVDLASLHSIRKFATRWIDNAPPRRLDMIILCAGTLTPPGGKRMQTEEGVEETWMVNYLANFHLLSILSPALRAQPVDRDVRVIMTTCSSYIRSPSLKEQFDDKSWSPGAAYARSKLALTVFGRAYQKHLDSYKRPDGLPMNSRVIFADPGYCRTAGMRRWLTRGSLVGLAIYVCGYFWPWLLLKSPEKGAQSILYAAMESSLGRGEGGKLVKECLQVDFARSEVKDEEVAKKLWEETDSLIEKLEKLQAKKRAARKAEDEKAAKEREDKERSEEIDSLMSAIKKGKAKDKSKSKKKDKDRDKEREKSKGSDKSDKSDKSKSKKKSKKSDS